MPNLRLTGQEQYILQLALKNFEQEVSKSEFQLNAIFTKEFILNHITCLSKKIEKLQEELETVNSN